MAGPRLPREPPTGQRFGMFGVFDVVALLGFSLGFSGVLGVFGSVWFLFLDLRVCDLANWGVSVCVLHPLNERGLQKTSKTDWAKGKMDSNCEKSPFWYRKIVFHV